jgi:uncharacterized alpha-E superfamily protein
MDKKLKVVYKNAIKRDNSFANEVIYKLAVQNRPSSVFRFLYDSHNGVKTARVDVLSPNGWEFLKNTATTTNTCADYLCKEETHIAACNLIFKEFETYIYALYID